MKTIKTPEECIKNQLNEERLTPIQFDGIRRAIEAYHAQFTVTDEEFEKVKEAFAKKWDKQSSPEYGRALFDCSKSLLSDLDALLAMKAGREMPTEKLLDKKLFDLWLQSEHKDDVTYQNAFVDCYNWILSHLQSTGVPAEEKESLNDTIKRIANRKDDGCWNCDVDNCKIYSSGHKCGNWRARKDGCWNCKATGCKLRKSLEIRSKSDQVCGSWK